MGASASASAHGPTCGVYVRRVCTHFGVLPWRCKASACTNTVTNPVLQASRQCQFRTSKVCLDRSRSCWTAFAAACSRTRVGPLGRRWTKSSNHEASRCRLNHPEKNKSLAACISTAGRWTGGHCKTRTIIATAMTMARSNRNKNTTRLSVGNCPEMCLWSSRAGIF